MRTKTRTATSADIVALIEKQLIVQLGLAGVPQRAIREIVQCDLNRVTKIVRHLRRHRGPQREDHGNEA